MKQGIEYRNIIENIRQQMLRGEITVDEAKKLAQPTINKMNARGAEIAKKFGRKFNKLTWGYLAR